MIMASNIQWGCRFVLEQTNTKPNSENEMAKHHYATADAGGFKQSAGYRLAQVHMTKG